LIDGNKGRTEIQRHLRNSVHAISKIHWDWFLIVFSPLMFYFALCFIVLSRGRLLCLDFLEGMAAVPTEETYRHRHWHHIIQWNQMMTRKRLPWVILN
jgi:hypothetical protein